MLSSSIFYPLGEVNCLFKYWHVVESCPSSGPDSTPRTDLYVFPTEREKEKKNKKLTHLQSGTNRIIQEMAAVCTGAAKIRLLLKTQWAGVTVFWCRWRNNCSAKGREGDRYGHCLCLPGGDTELPSGWVVLSLSADSWHIHAAAGPLHPFIIASLHAPSAQTCLSSTHTWSKRQSKDDTCSKVNVCSD